MLTNDFSDELTGSLKDMKMLIMVQSDCSQPFYALNGWLTIGYHEKGLENMDTFRG